MFYLFRKEHYLHICFLFFLRNQLCLKSGYKSIRSKPHSGGVFVFKHQISACKLSQMPYLNLFFGCLQLSISSGAIFKKCQPSGSMPQRNTDHYEWKSHYFIWILGSIEINFLLFWNSESAGPEFWHPDITLPFCWSVSTITFCSSQMIMAPLDY